MTGRTGDEDDAPSYVEIARRMYPRLDASWEGQIVGRVAREIDYMDLDAIVALYTVLGLYLARA